jgi:hypothetical protein
MLWWTWHPGNVTLPMAFSSNGLARNLAFLLLALKIRTTRFSSSFNLLDFEQCLPGIEALSSLQRILRRNFGRSISAIANLREYIFESKSDGRPKRGYAAASATRLGAMLDTLNLQSSVHVIRALRVAIIRICGATMF